MKYKSKAVCDTPKETEYWKPITKTEKFRPEEVSDVIINRVAYYFAERVREFYSNKENYDNYLKRKAQKDAKSNEN